MSKNLTPEQKLILYEEGTEAPGSSSLNQEKREGSYHCVGCGTNLFESKRNILTTSDFGNIRKISSNICEPD